MSEEKETPIEFQCPSGHFLIQTVYACVRVLSETGFNARQGIS